MARSNTTTGLLLPLSGMLMACLLAGTVREPGAITPTPLADVDPIVMVPPSTIDLAATSMPQGDIDTQLAGYGITLAGSADLPDGGLRTILAAADILGDRCPELLGLDKAREEDRHRAVSALFGPTVIRVYQDRARVDGVNYAINCGWEGRGAEGCKHPDIFPEQEFPSGAWLILFAGQPLLDDHKNTALIIHELSHNLTWGGGHLTDSITGFSYPRYVGDDFAIQYSSDLGVQLGSDAYGSPAAREANPRWRSEITADAIASWMLGLFQGPYADSISSYIHDMLVCEITNAPKC